MNVNYPPPLFPAPKTLIFSIWALPVAKFDFIEGRAAFRTIYIMRGPTFIFSKKSVFSVNSRSLLRGPRVSLKLKKKKFENMVGWLKYGGETTRYRPSTYSRTLGEYKDTLAVDLTGCRCRWSGIVLTCGCLIFLA